MITSKTISENNYFKNLPINNLFATKTRTRAKDYSLQIEARKFFPWPKDRSSLFFAKIGLHNNPSWHLSHLQSLRKKIDQMSMFYEIDQEKSNDINNLNELLKKK